MKELATKFKIHPSTIIRLKEKEEEYRLMAQTKENMVKVRLPNDNWYGQLDDKLYQFVDGCNAKSFPVNQQIIKRKALALAQIDGKKDFKATRTWFQKMKKRTGLSIAKACGEAKSVNKSLCDEWKNNELPRLIEENAGYEIWNADETGLMFKAIPQKSYFTKNADRSGLKLPKDRITVLLCASIDGKKKRPLIIGKSKKPHSFAAISYDTSQFEVDYKHSVKAWMTGQIYSEWLREWDQQLIAEDKHVLLFIDNCPAHKLDKDVKLTNIKLQLLPVNTTSCLQPLDGGIIRNFKHFYFSQLNDLLISLMGTDTDIETLIKSITLKEAVELVGEAWEKVTQLTITNCFGHCGFYPNP